MQLLLLLSIYLSIFHLSVYLSIYFHICYFCLSIFSCMLCMYASIYLSSYIFTCPFTSLSAWNDDHISLHDPGAWRCSTRQLWPDASPQQTPRRRSPLLLLHREGRKDQEKVCLIPLSRLAKFTRVHPGEYPFTLASELPGKFFLSALFHRKYVINYACIMYACAKCSMDVCVKFCKRGGKRARKEKSVWPLTFNRDFTRSLTAIPFILQDLPGAPGCTRVLREITREDSRVKFPKSLPAFYPRFYPRDLSYYKISRVHPGKIC